MSRCRGPKEPRIPTDARCRHLHGFRSPSLCRVFSGLEPPGVGQTENGGYGEGSLPAFMGYGPEGLLSPSMRKRSLSRPGEKAIHDPLAPLAPLGVTFVNTLDSRTSEGNALRTKPSSALGTEGSQEPTLSQP